MNMSNIFLSVLTAALCSGLISFSTTPIASFIAYRIGAVDVPKDGRRMHKKPIPRLGRVGSLFCISCDHNCFLRNVSYDIVSYSRGTFNCSCGSN